MSGIRQITVEEIVSRSLMLGEPRLCKQIESYETRSCPHDRNAFTEVSTNVCIILLAWKMF